MTFRALLGVLARDVACAVCGARASTWPALLFAIAFYALWSTVGTYAFFAAGPLAILIAVVVSISGVHASRARGRTRAFVAHTVVAFLLATLVYRWGLTVGLLGTLALLVLIIAILRRATTLDAIAAFLAGVAAALAFAFDAGAVPERVLPGILLLTYAVGAGTIVDGRGAATRGNRRLFAVASVVVAIAVWWAAARSWGGVPRRDWAAAAAGVAALGAALANARAGLRTDDTRVERPYR